MFVMCTLGKLVQGNIVKFSYMGCRNTAKNFLSQYATCTYVAILINKSTLTLSKVYCCTDMSKVGRECTNFVTVSRVVLGLQNGQMTFQNDIHSVTMTTVVQLTELGVSFYKTIIANHLRFIFPVFVSPFKNEICTALLVRA